MKEKILFTKSHRFFDGAVTYFSSLASVNLVRDSIRKGFAEPYEKNEAFVFVGKLTNVTYRFFPYDTYSKIMENSWPSQIELGVVAKVKEPAKTISGFKYFYSSITQSTFINYFESIKSDIKGLSNPPDILEFGRVIRNAFAHNNKIDIRNKDASPVKWKTLEYSYKDTGRQILFNDVDPVEIMILMKEMDESF